MTPFLGGRPWSTTMPFYTAAALLRSLPPFHILMDGGNKNATRFGWSYLLRYTRIIIRSRWAARPMDKVQIFDPFSPVGLSLGGGGVDRAPTSRVHHL
jgi:hypothetical protein